MDKNQDVLDKYEFVEKLGEGSFGEVWLVKDPKLGENVALKYLRLEKASEDYLELFKREFEILSELRHTNLANVYDFGFSPKKEQYFFTSEFCPGKEFFEAAEGQPIAFVEEMLVQILSALDYTHSQGIVHFDIKSENVLVSQEGERPHVKLLDFGVASKLKALPQGVIGTPSYMAPEIVTKGAKVDHRADLYSLGILLLRTLTDRLPFDIENTGEIIQWHVKGTLPEEIWAGKEVPRYLKELVEKLLAKKPSDRFSNARVVLHFLNLSTGRKYLKAEQNLEGKIPREGPLVEREELLDSLRNRFSNAVLKDAEKPEPSVCIISGAQGMGKTRILNEMRHVIELKEIPFFEVVCDWQVPAWSKIEKWLEVTPAITEDMSEDWQMRLRIDAIIETAKKKPICLLIDEFHKADRITKAILPALEQKLKADLQGGRHIPIFIIAATEESAERNIPLKRLSVSGINKYINLVLGESERSSSIAELIHQYSGGLPLLMVEGLRFLAPHLYKDEPLENLLPPPQIGLLYREKIDALQPDENELLSILAMLFRPTRKEELCKILNATDGVITSLADACIKDELISSSQAEETQNVTYQVSSQALSLDIIKSIKHEAGQKLHDKIATGLSTISATPLNEIAYHTAKSGKVDKAIKYYREAASNYKKDHQVSTATDCLVKAINLCTPQSPAWKELLQETSQLLIVSGSYREAENYLNQFSGKTTYGIEEQRGILALKRRKLPEAVESYQRSFELVPKDDLLQRILIENSLANAYLQQGKLNEAAEIFKRTLGDEVNLKPEDRNRVTNNSLGLTLAFLGDIDGAIAFYEGQKKKLEPGKTNDEITLENSLGYVLIYASRYGESIPHLRKAMELSEQSGSMHSLFSSIGNLISALLKEARYAESLPLLQKMREYQERLGTLRDIAYNLLREGSVYLTVGMEETANECLKKGRKISQEMNDPVLATWFLLMQAYREREYGDRDKAKEIFILTELEAREQGDTELMAWSHYALADMAYDVGDKEQAKLQLDLVTDPPKDAEFRLRMELLQATISPHQSDQEINDIFSNILEQCKKDNLQELQWEVYHGWGVALAERGNRTGAIPILLKGIKVIETISSSLPEEYRDRYLKQHSRRELFDYLKKLTSPDEKPKPSKPTKFRISPAAEGTVADDEETLKTPSEGTIAEVPKKAREGTVAEAPTKKPTAEGTVAERPLKDYESTIRVEDKPSKKKKKKKKRK